MFRSTWYKSLLLTAWLWAFVSPSSASTGFRQPAFHNHPNKQDLLAGEDGMDDIQAPNTTTTTTTQAITIPEWKRVLPAPLNNKTKTLQRIIVPGPDGSTVQVYLLGTAHVSMDSSKDVQLLLDCIQPNVIFLELCDQRIGMLLTTPPKSNNTTTTTTTSTITDDEEQQEPPTGKKRWWQRHNDNKKKTAAAPKQPKSLYATAASLLTNMQQDYADSLNVELGGEFRVAYEFWNQHRLKGQLHMILGDRPLYLTLTRAWESLGLWGKTKLLVGLLISTFQKPNPEELREWMKKILEGGDDDSEDLLTQSIAELAKHFPSLEQVIIKERDAYLACKLYQTCRQLLLQAAAAAAATNNRRPPQHFKVVAIVGAGHVDGMCTWLTKSPSEETPEQVLARLIQIKNTVPEEDQQILTQEVMEVNHELLQEMAREMQEME